MMAAFIAQGFVTFRRFRIPSETKDDATNTH